jgi:hypothetical protein
LTSIKRACLVDKDTCLFGGECQVSHT